MSPKISFTNMLTGTNPVHIHRNGGLGAVKDQATGETDLRHPDAHKLFDSLCLALLNLPDAEKRESRLKVVTFSDMPNRTILEKSVDKVGGSSYCCGREEAGKFWKNNNKIQLSLDYLEQTSSEYVLFSDGFDAILIDHPDVLLDRFLEMGVSGMISGEQVCYPIDYQHRDEDLKNATGPYPFGNSGAVIGKTVDLLPLYRKALTMPPSKDKPNDDQCKIRAAAAEFGFVIDTKAELLQTLSSYTEGDCLVKIPNEFVLDEGNKDYQCYLKSESKSRKKDEIAGQNRPKGLRYYAGQIKKRLKK